jgi:hypothetical protein
MRSFRFPVWMIALLLTVLVTVIVAIEKTRTLSAQLSGGPDVPSGWWALPAIFGLVVVLTGGVALFALGVKRLLRR